MLTITPPGREPLLFDHLVCDFNGTLACDGVLLANVAERLARISQSLAVHILTAGTHGGIDAARRQLDAEFLAAGAPQHVVWRMVGTGEEKARYVATLGSERVVAVGNGANDAPMLRIVALGIAIMGPEGLAREAAEAAGVLCPSILAALDLLLIPKRLQATLRL